MKNYNNVTYFVKLAEINVIFKIFDTHVHYFTQFYSKITNSLAKKHLLGEVWDKKFRSK